MKTKVYKRLVLLLIAFTGCCIHIDGQEIILPLSGNPEVRSHLQLFPAKKAVSEVTLELPVLDDFSYDTPFPDPLIWINRFVYINRTYAIDPVSVGVATLDAVDENGSVFSNATISPKTFNADVLTSQPVNLEYPASDSIYLSFLFQPQGTGLMPGSGDSLIVDFYDPNAALWKTVWKTPGDTLRPFRKVMIPVIDTNYLNDGFRFRFRNLASLPHNSDYKDKRGNVDHWNIDYVNLDRQRTYDDTILRDVAFSKPLPSMLQDYQAVPWDHLSIAYNTNYLPFVEIDYFNNDTATRNITRYLEITDLVSNEIFTPGAPTTQDIFPGTGISAKISSIYPFNFGQGDTAHLEIKSYLRTDDFDYKANDTISRVQVFRDFFSRDDGSAERAYGLRGQGTINGLIAVRFNSFIPDELGGLDIYFTQLKDSLNLEYDYSLRVWDDNEGVPGNVLYDFNREYNVQYSDELNKFTRIFFDHPVPVSGIYYVGLIQYTSLLLNIGVDINNPANESVLYNTGNGWDISGTPGSLMIRPFVKRAYSSAPQIQVRQAEVNLYPNPASEFIYMQFPENVDKENTEVDIFTITGQRVYSQNNAAEPIFVGNLPGGVYVVTFKSDSYALTAKRIIITK